MKIVGIISSPTRSGNTAALVREALRAASECGAEVEEIFLAGKDIRFCNGCLGCMAEGRCRIPDDFEEIRARLYACDGIVIGSPTYGMEPNAIMKNFLDRLGMYTVYTSSLAGKYVVGISTAGGFGADAVAKKLTAIVNGMFGRGRVSGTLGVVRGWDRVVDKPALLVEARILGRKLVEDIRGQRAYPFQDIKDRIVTALVVRPMIRRNILDHRHDRMRAVYEDLTARGLLRPLDPPRTHEQTASS